MKVTAITAQVKDKNRVNVMIDGAYRFSLDIFQVGELGIRVGKEYTAAELDELEAESIFGKLYSRTLQYCMMRLHSAKEIKDYLWKKTRDSRGSDGQIRKGIAQTITERVYHRLTEKGYINDEVFARHWIENRHMSKGASRRKIIAELRTKGIEQNLIDRLLQESNRTDEDELAKMIAKKRDKYNDQSKLIHYLVRQGFSYDDVKRVLAQ